MLVAAAGSAGYWSHFLLTFALRFAYVFLTLKTAHTKPYENQCSANRTVKDMWKHIDCQRHGAWPQSTIQPLLHVLFGLGHIDHIKINQTTNEYIQKQYKLNMKTYASNMCYSWLTFLLTFLAGRLTFFLTFSYKVRTVLEAYILIITTGGSFQKSYMFAHIYYMI